MMKLQNICTILSSNQEEEEEGCPLPTTKTTTTTTLQLTSCSDSKQYMDPFLTHLTSDRCQIKRLIVRTDFLTSLSSEDEDYVFRFFKALGRIPMLEEFILQSSSRFHVDTIPYQRLFLHLKEMKTLQILQLQDMQITAIHKPTFIYGLGMGIRYHPTIHAIRMHNFFANDWANTTPYVLDPLFDSIMTIPKLQRLECSGCGSHALRGQDVPLLSTQTLYGIIYTISTLQHLELSFLELDDDHFEMLANSLKEKDGKKKKKKKKEGDGKDENEDEDNEEEDCNQSVLESLYLDYHKLGPRGIKSMMEAFETNRTIKTLSLRSLCEIGEVGYQQTMKMLSKNYWLQSLSITSTPYQQGQMDILLRMNIAGRYRLKKERNMIPLTEWVDILINVNHDMDVIQHFLQELPELCHAATTTTTTTMTTTTSTTTTTTATTTTTTTTTTSCPVIPLSEEEEEESDEQEIPERSSPRSTTIVVPG